jgi:hypothetical protein
MTVCWFGQFPAASPDLTWLADVLGATPALRPGVIYTPSSTSDPYLDDGPSPKLVLQLYFDDIAALEAAVAPNGHLQQLGALDMTGATQQAMLVRRFPVPDPVFRTARTNSRAHILLRMRVRPTTCRRGSPTTSTTTRRSWRGSPASARWRYTPV